jgi:hypothetical protein
MSICSRWPLILAIPLVALLAPVGTARACGERCRMFELSSTRGVLLTADEKPIPNARLIVRDASPSAKGPAMYCARRGQVVLKTATDGHGNFQLKGLHSGIYFVTYMDPKEGESFLVKLNSSNSPKQFRLTLFDNIGVCYVGDVEREVVKPAGWGDVLRRCCAETIIIPD